MENKYRWLLTIFIVGITVLLVGVLMAFNFYKDLDDPQTCNLCHEMKPYFSSFINPAEGSAIKKHDLKCLDCHTNTSPARARSTIIKEIEVSALNKITGIKLDTSSSDLAVNCTRCHFMDDFLHLDAIKNASCPNCHWAHVPPLVVNETIRIALIPYGPHRNQTCQNCHGTTFKIPQCTQCHAGHGEQKLENKLCLGCHVEPHVPKRPGILYNNTVKFTGNPPFNTCQPCHEKQYFEIEYSFSKHSNMLTCTLCHEYHGEKPGCGKCHKGMMMKRHPDFICKDCHITYNPARTTCQSCHGMSHEWSASTAIPNPR